MSDIDRIIRYMRENGSITCKECEQRIGTTELRRRICDIKDMGYEIGDVWEDGENREGNPTRYKRYFIQKEPDCAVRAKKEPCEPKEKHSFWDRFNRIKKLTGIKKQSTINKQQREDKMTTYKTSEWVSLGHSDKMADYISEYILDRLIEKDPETRYGLEVQIKSQNVNIAGEITTYADTTISMYEKWVKEAIQEIGYNQNYQKKFGSQNTIDGQYVNVICNIWGQSPDIAKGVDDNGWGDQGIFFGYYCNETPEGQGYEYQLAKDIGKKIYEKALSPNSVLGLDIKTQVTISLEANRDPERMVEEIIIAVPMVEGKEKEGKKEIKEILKQFPDTLHTHVIINGTGKYTRHGPVADAGTTGRKLVVDFYGGRSRIGGGSPWTKDGTKADLSLNLLAFDLAKDYFNELKEMEAPIHHTEVELSCCIGRKEVLMQLIAYDEEGNPFHRMNDLKTIKHSELIKRYHLDKPIYAQLCREGLFSIINSKDKIREKKQ